MVTALMIRRKTWIRRVTSIKPVVNDPGFDTRQFKEGLSVEEQRFSAFDGSFAILDGEHLASLAQRGLCSVVVLDQETSLPSGQILHGKLDIAEGDEQSMIIGHGAIQTILKC